MLYVFGQVLRTKASTDTAKKLEMSLEETFGNPNFRDMKNKKKQVQTFFDS